MSIEGGAGVSLAALSSRDVSIRVEAMNRVLEAHQKTVAAARLAGVQVRATAAASSQLRPLRLDADGYPWQQKLVHAGVGCSVGRPASAAAVTLRQ